MGYACDALNLFDPTHDPDAAGRDGEGANGLCAALQSAEITGFAANLHGGAKGVADAVAKLEQGAKRAGLVLRVASAVLEGQEAPVAKALSGHLTRFAQAAGGLEQAAKGVGKPLRGMQGSAAQVQWVLAMVSALEAADEAAANLASNPGDFEAAAQHARATAEALGQASGLVKKLPAPLNTLAEPLFAGIPQVVDQVVGLIEARVARIDAEAGFGPMQGATCTQNGEVVCRGSDARAVCFKGASRDTPGCREGE